MESASQGRTYLDSQGKNHAFFKSTAKEYENESINLKALMGGYRADNGIGDFLNNNLNQAGQVGWDTRFRAGQVAGSGSADQESSLFSDIGRMLSGTLELPGYALRSVTDSQVGPLDDKQMADYYQKLLRLQGRAEEAGYVSEYEWATTQRMMWSGAIAGEIGGLLVGSGIALARTGKAASGLDAVSGATATTGKNPNLTSAKTDAEAGGFSYYDRFRKSDGTWNWPESLGFAEPPSTSTLSVGARLDRYGSPDGAFLSPKGTSYEQRALAPGSRAGGYYEYEVIKPMPVIQGKVAPAFDQPGGGMQILPSFPSRVNVQWLIDNGYLRQVK